MNVKKTANVTQAHAGDAVNYTIWVNNTGSDDLYNVWVNDSEISLSENIGILKNHTSHKIYKNYILSSLPDPFINTVYAEGYDILGTRYNDTDSASVDIIKAGLNVKKTGNPPIIESGETVTWNITVENTGDCILYNVWVNDSNRNVAFIPSLVPGDKKYYEYTTNPTDNVTNIVYANATDLLGKKVSDSDAAIVEVLTPPSLSITKTDSPDPVVVGNNLTYIVTIKNIGTSPAYNVVINEQYDKCFTFVSSRPSASYGNNIWNFSVINPREEKNIYIYARVGDTDEGEVFNVVTYTSSNAGTGRANQTTNIIYPLIKIKKDAPSSVEAGKEINYTIRYFNMGNIDLTNVVIREIYPENTTFLSASLYPDIGNNTWLIGNLPHFSTGSIKVTLSVNSSVKNGTRLINYVEISCNENVSSNATAITTVIQTSPSLNISKSASPNPVVAGNELNYTIVVKNNGNIDATNVTVTDKYNNLLDITNADNGTILNGKIMWNIPILHVGESMNFLVKAKVKSIDEETMIHNFVNVTCNEGAYDEDNITTIVKPTPSMGYPFLEITKEDKVDPVYYRSEIEYEIVVKNIGDGAATNVVVKDFLEKGLNYVNANPSPEKINGSDLEWDIGRMEAGQIIVISLYVEADKFGVLNDTASVTCEEGLYDEAKENTTVIDDTEPPSTRKVFHGEVENVSVWGIYILHYIPKSTYITLKSVDYPAPGGSGVNHTYYRLWKWDKNNSKWTLIFDWKEYYGENIYLYNLEGYGKYEIEFYSIDRVGNIEKVEWNDIYVYES